MGQASTQVHRIVNSLPGGATSGGLCSYRANLLDPPEWARCPRSSYRPPAQWLRRNFLFPLAETPIPPSPLTP